MTLVPSRCASDVAQALLANKLELALCGGGGIVEVEYHVDPASIPQMVRDAMDALHPGGPFTDAERELNDGVMYYELLAEIEVPVG